LSAVVAHAERAVKLAWIPDLHPDRDFDLNDWTREMAEAGASVDEIRNRILEVVRNASAPQTPEEPLRLSDAVNDSAKLWREFSTIAVPKRQVIFDDWFKEGDLGFIYAPRGVGKTWISLSLAIAISSGGQGGPWHSQVTWPVLYIDGEMMCEDDKSRISGLNGADQLQLHILNHEVLFYSHQRVLNLASSEAQEAITKLCLERGIQVLFIDNLSCLFTGVAENDADDWEKVLPWLLHLRRQRIAVVIEHHTGVNRERMRGTSKREDGASWVLRLDNLENRGPGSHFISRFTKMRGRNATPDYEWHFIPNGTHVDVTTKPANRADTVLQWVRDGLESCEAIAREMGITTGAVSKLATRLIDENKLHKKGRYYAAGPPPGTR
jgi:AAA domain-containing protein